METLITLGVTTLITLFFVGRYLRTAKRRKPAGFAARRARRATRVAARPDSTAG